MLLVIVGILLRYINNSVGWTMIIIGAILIIVGTLKIEKAQKILDDIEKEIECGTFIKKINKKK